MFFKEQMNYMPKTGESSYLQRLAVLQMRESFGSTGNALAFMAGGGLTVDDYIIILHNLHMHYI